jgi:hypothetical protein
MAGTLTFNVGEVRKIYEHAKAATAHSPDIAHLFDPAFHKGGTVVKKDGWPDKDNLIMDKIPACLTLVGDHGIYLMSNGSPAQLKEEGKTSRVVVYAKESNPDSLEFDDWYTAKEVIFGGDDGSEPLPLSMFESIMAKRKDSEDFKIKLTKSKIQVIG